MQCANYLCIYEKDGGCTLDGIFLIYGARARNAFI